MRKSRQVSCLFVLVLGLLGPLKSQAESMGSYQEDIQRIFIREAATQSQFTKAVQTARLLAYLEFMEPEAFSKFSQCMAKEKNWDVLSAKGREQALNRCRAQGRMVSSASSSSFLAPAAVSPATNQKQEQDMASIKRELSDIREMVEKLSQAVKQNQEKTTEGIDRISSGQLPSRAPSQGTPPAPEQPLY